MYRPVDMVKKLSSPNAHAAMKKILMKLDEINNAVPGSIDFEETISVDLGVKLNYNERVGIAILLGKVGWENIDIKDENIQFYFPMTDV